MKMPQIANIFMKQLRAADIRILDVKKFAANHNFIMR